jgi:hypothetical protein
MNAQCVHCAVDEQMLAVDAVICEDGCRERRRRVGRRQSERSGRCVDRRGVSPKGVIHPLKGGISGTLKDHPASAGRVGEQRRFRSTTDRHRIDVPDAAARTPEPTRTSCRRYPSWGATSVATIRECAFRSRESAGVRAEGCRGRAARLRRQDVEAEIEEVEAKGDAGRGMPVRTRGCRHCDSRCGWLFRHVTAISKSTDRLARSGSRRLDHHGARR